MAPHKVLHYGLNRSGTNYLQELMLKRLNIEFINKERDRTHSTHKHFRLYDNKELIGRPNFNNKQVFNSFMAFEKQLTSEYLPDFYVIISKDPYSWNLSYSAWGKKNNWPPSPHPFIMEYNEFYKKWLEFSKETTKIIFVKYIDLLNNEDAVFNQIIRESGVKAKTEYAGKRIKKVPMSHRFTSKNLNYYINEEYLSDYSELSLSELNAYLDHDVVKKLGYNSHY